MRSHSPTRITLAALAVWLAAVPAFAHGQDAVELPPPRPAQWAARPRANGRVLLAQNLIRFGLQQWIEQHRNLPPAEQERALENDPGFRALNPQQQQRMLTLFRQVQGMPPQQRNPRWAFLRLTPQQQQQLDTVLDQYGALPPSRKPVVHSAFAALRRVPPPQRQAAMASYPPLRQLSPYERQILANLLFWEPYLTAGAPNQTP
jgi:hypothetical protein